MESSHPLSFFSFAGYFEVVVVTPWPSVRYIDINKALCENLTPVVSLLPGPLIPYLSWVLVQG